MHGAKTRNLHYLHMLETDIGSVFWSNSNRHYELTFVTKAKNGLWDFRNCIGPNPGTHVSYEC
jgi:hypothetical protein